VVEIPTKVVEIPKKVVEIPTKVGNTTTKEWSSKQQIVEDSATTILICIIFSQK
jgi:hypothetical protein